DFVDYFEIGKEYSDGEIFEFVNELISVKDKDSDILFNNVVDKVVVLKQAKRTTARTMELPTLQIILKERFYNKTDIVLSSNVIINIK
ncbi:MAG: hypothetical protein ACRCUM_02390, partial [Mycoplasmoidaceae bacterium]